MYKIIVIVIVLLGHHYLQAQMMKHTTSQPQQEHAVMMHHKMAESDCATHHCSAPHEMKICEQIKSDKMKISTPDFSVPEIADFPFLAFHYEPLYQEYYKIDLEKIKPSFQQLARSHLS